MPSAPVPRPHHSKYPTPDAYKADRYYGSSYGQVNGHEFYFKELPHYITHTRAIQRGGVRNAAKVRAQYRGQFLCGGWSPLPVPPVHCGSTPQQPVCKCTSMPSYC